MSRDHGLDDLPLHADTATVDQSDFAEPSGERRFEVLVDDGGNVARGERMEIERVLDRNANGLVYSRGPSITCCFQ